MDEDAHSGKLTGLVLAGGASRRMGRDKAFLDLGGQPMIRIVVDRITMVCDEVIIVVSGDLGRYVDLGTNVVADQFEDVGALGGLHAGLDAASHELALAVGCDMPFLKPDVLRAFADWASGFDVTLLRYNGYVQPLHAAYRRSCVPAIDAAIRAGERRIISFFPHVRVRHVTPEEVAAIDPDLRSFRNINTPEQWEAARAAWPETSER